MNKHFKCVTQVDLVYYSYWWPKCLLFWWPLFRYRLYVTYVYFLVKFEFPLIFSFSTSKQSKKILPVFNEVLCWFLLLRLLLKLKTKLYHFIRNTISSDSILCVQLNKFYRQILVSMQKSRDTPRGQLSSSTKHRCLKYV